MHKLDDERPDGVAQHRGVAAVAEISDHAKGSKVYVEGKHQPGWEDRQSGERKLAQSLPRDLLCSAGGETAAANIRVNPEREEEQPPHAGSGEIVDQDIPLKRLGDSCTSLGKKS